MGEVVLVGCEYNQLVSNTPVLNIFALGPTVWVQIPVQYKKYDLFEIHDISGKVSREVDFFGKAKFDHDHPWIGLPIEIFNLRSGKHIYKLVFLDTETNLQHLTFISYVSQDDNPETSYIYMKNRGNNDPEGNTWKDGKYADTFYENLRQEVEQTYGYDPLLFGETTSSWGSYNYCSTCVLPTCEQCPYRQE